MPLPCWVLFLDLTRLLCSAQLLACQLVKLTRVPDPNHRAKGLISQLPICTRLCFLGTPRKCLPQIEGEVQGLEIIGRRWRY